MTAATGAHGDRASSAGPAPAAAARSLRVAATLATAVGLLASTHAQVDTGQSRLFRFLMGTSVRVELSGGDDLRRAEAADEAFAAVADVERVMSDYRPDSELARVNATAAGQPVIVSGPLFAVVAAAERIEATSGRAFTAVVAGRGVGRPLLLNAAERTIRFTAPGVRLSLDGLAKGFAAELAAGSLRRRDLSGTVDIGGVQFMVGRPVGKPLWTVGIAHPSVRGALLGALEVTGGAVATATHTVAGSGSAPLHEAADTRLATVVSADGTLADALSRAAVTLQPAEALALLARFQDTWGLVASRGPDGALSIAVSAGHASAFHQAPSR